jgi:hypothetical protein
MAPAMSPFPVRTASLASDLPPANLARLLRGVVGDGPAAPFGGEVSPDGFVITRMNLFRSTFMPRLHGGFAAAAGGGTRVRLRLRPPGTVVAFMAVWLLFLGALAAVVVAAHARGGGASLLLLAAPAGLGALSWFLMAAVFSADARWAIEHLIETIPALRPEAGS